MKKLFYIFCIFTIFLSGCSKREPSTVLTEETQKEIVQLQKDIQKSTCDNKEVLISKLNSINTEVKSINTMCNLRYGELKQENSKLKWIIGFLLTIGCGLIYLLTKKR